MVARTLCSSARLIPTRCDARPKYSLVVLLLNLLSELGCEQQNDTRKYLRTHKLHPYWLVLTILLHPVQWCLHATLKSSSNYRVRSLHYTCEGPPVGTAHKWMEQWCPDWCWEVYPRGRGKARPNHLAWRHGGFQRLVIRYHWGCGFQPAVTEHAVRLPRPKLWNAAVSVFAFVRNCQALRATV